MLLALFVFLLQPVKTGFEKGHHGWVSSHTLAIATRAAPENYFLGYTSERMTVNGPDKEYFDRYPIFFSGITHLVLKPFWDNFKLHIYMARQWMNLIYFLMAWLVLKILDHFLSREKAIAALSIVLSSAFLVYYKDMVHFDQTALLGCLWVLAGILEYEKKRNPKLLVLGTIVGPLLGRGYAVIFFLLAWYLVRSFRSWRNEKSILVFFREKALCFFVCSIPLPALMLAFNVLAEAKIRNKSWDETSIVVSAKHRLGMKSYTSKAGEEKKFRWPSFVLDQLQRTLDLSTPYAIYGIHVKNYKNKFTHYTTVLPKFFFQLALVWFLVIWGRKYWQALPLETKDYFLIFISSGFLWILAMRNLARFHEYVTMYAIGCTIVFSILVVEFLDNRRLKLLPYLPILLLVSLFLNSLRGNLVAEEVNWQAGEFEKIRSELKFKKVKSVFLLPSRYQFMKGVPHGPDYFLSGYFLADSQDLAQTVLRNEGSSILIVDGN